MGNLLEYKATCDTPKLHPVGGLGPALDPPSKGSLVPVQLQAQGRATIQTSRLAINVGDLDSARGCLSPGLGAQSDERFRIQCAVFGPDKCILSEKLESQAKCAKVS